MSLTIANITTATSTSAGATLDLTGVTAAIGDLLVLGVAADNAGASGVTSTSSTITDAAGNTWTQRASTTYSPGGAAADGATLTIFTSTITSPLSSATLTVNFSPDTTSKAAGLKKVTPTAGATVVVDSAGSGVTGTGTAHSSGNVSVPLGSVIFGFTAIESISGGLTNDSDTTNGSWSTAQTAFADTGTVATSQCITGQQKAVTATGNQSYDTSNAATRDWALNYLILHEQVAAALAATEGTDSAALAVTVANLAALAATEDADTAALAGDVYLAAGLVVIEDADTADLAAGVSNIATLAATETADIAAIAVGVTVFASFAPVERADRADFVISPFWPDALPLPTLAGYGLKASPSVLRVPVEIGAARVYRRAKALAEVTVVWQLSGWQQMLLDGFYRSIVFEGGWWFAVTLAFPSGLALVSARFKDKLAMKALGGQRWQASATLEVMQRPVMSDADLTVLLDDEGADPAWPTALLPKPLQDSWTLEPQPALVRSEDLSGLPRQRQRARNSVTNVAAAWELDAAQAALFDGFFRWRGMDGARWFDFPLYQGMGTTTAQVRFTGEADWTPRGGGRWNVAAPLEIRERQILTAAEYQTMVMEDPDALFDAVDQISEVVADLAGE